LRKNIESKPEMKEKESVRKVVVPTKKAALMRKSGVDSNPMTSKQQTNH